MSKTRIQARASCSAFLALLALCAGAEAATVQRTRARRVPASRATVNIAPEPTTSVSFGMDPIVFNNTAASGSFHDISGGTIVFDEGRVPSTTSPENGLQDSYSITEFEIGYATRALDVSSGGVGARVRVAFYAAGAMLPGSVMLPPPTAIFDLTGLPASSAAGVLSTHVVTVSPQSPVCFRADADGKYVAGAPNGFVWAFAMPDELFGSAGPLVAGDPASCARGNGTYFQATGACGTGLGSVDGFGTLLANGAHSYGDLGGYPQSPFGSFHLLIRAPLAGDCVGCGIADPFLEDNDTCATAVPVPLGATTGLISEAGDDDFYVFSNPANSSLTATALFDGAQADLDLELYDVGCGQLLASSRDVGSDEVLAYLACSGVARDLVLRVVASSTGCVDYDLFLEAETVVDDAFEDNDTCAQSQLAGVSTFTTRGLVVTECDPDYYVLRLINQREVQVELLFDHDDANVDLRLLDLNCGQVLAASTSTTDNELARYLNASGVQSAVVVEVTCAGGRGFATYDLTACYSVGDVISFQQCSGMPNSTGLPATMCARGSDIATDNLVLFYAVDLPSQAFGYFVTSLSTDFIQNVGGGQGTLCLGTNGIGRYSTDVLMTNNNNAAFYQPDLTRTPTSGAPLSAVVAGETRYWQFWYRDSNGMGGSTSNFSGAAGIHFQ